MPGPASDTGSPPPVILTLLLDEASQVHFDRLRSQYFPPARLLVGAHVTLFHALPGAQEDAIQRHVAVVCATMQAFPVAVRRLRSLGRGVAYDLHAPPAQSLRAALAAPFADWLTPQDRAPWSPHVTIQNKVTAEVAHDTRALLAARPMPEPATALGVGVWRYLGGPWAPVARCWFGRKEAVLF